MQAIVTVSALAYFCCVLLQPLQPREVPPSRDSVLISCATILCCAIVQFSILSSCVITQTHTSTPKNVRKFLPLPTTIQKAPSLESNISIYTRMINRIFSFEGWARCASQSYMLTIWFYLFIYYPCQHHKGNSLASTFRRETYSNDFILPVLSGILKTLFNIHINPDISKEKKKSHWKCFWKTA